MAAPTNYYCNYSTAGNDYNHPSFTDGAYTSATKTLIKAGAFTHNKAGHRIYLESNDGGSIVAGLYTIATWTDADTIILATDAGAGSDDDAAKCTQHTGTALLPWNTIQGALDLIVRDAVNGDQINVVAGTAQVSYASISEATYGACTNAAPLIIRGCTAAENDGGIATINSNGFRFLAATDYRWNILADLIIHSFGDNNGVDFYSWSDSTIIHCEIHKGASTPSTKSLVRSAHVINSYIHDAGATGTGISGGSNTNIVNNYVYNCPAAGITSGYIIGNIVVDCPVIGISSSGSSTSIIYGNTVYCSTAATGTGIIAATAHCRAVLNNIVEGYSGAGGKGLVTAETVLIGYNAYYNCATPESLGDTWIDLGNDGAPAASPFTNAAAGNFALLTTAGVGVIETAFPGAWYGPAATTNKADRGAVQNGAGSGGISMPRVRVGH